MKLFKLLLFSALTVAAVSCKTTGMAYFGDVDQVSLDTLCPERKLITLRPNDKISIIVNSNDPQITDMFNLPYMTHRIGQVPDNYSSSGYVSCYTVNSRGEINFPNLGALQVGGMTREAVEDLVKEKLVERKLVKDPVVTVEYMNLTFSVTGEVTAPGRFNINKDDLTVLDALSMAGDLTIKARRDNLLVLRDEGGVKKSYRIDLSSTASIMTSPVYYLQQNDIIYVEANNSRKRESRAGGNDVRTASFWLSLTSVLTSLALVLVQTIALSKR